MSTAKGLIYFFVNTAFAKGVTFITQFVLGWLLMPEEYGLYAIVISIGVFVSILANGGMERVLIQRGDEIKRLQSTAVVYSLFFNFSAMAVFMLLSSVISEAYEDHRLYFMLIIMGFVFPLSTPAALYRIRLSIQQKYKQLAILKTISATVRQIMIVVLALNDYGVYSFVIPMVIEVIVESLVGAYFTRWSPSFNWFKLKIARELFKSCKWIMLANLMMGLAAAGDYFLLGLILTKGQLGMYFFGLQLVVSISAVFIMAIQGVMLPALMPLVNDFVQFRRVYTEALTKIFFISMPLSMLLSICSNTLIHWIWNGKWDEAIPITQVMFLGMPFWLMLFLACSCLEALGLWYKRLIYIGVYGVLSVSVAIMMAQTEKIIYIAAGVALIRGGIGLIQSLSIFHIIKVEYKSVLTQLILTLLIAITCGIISLSSVKILGLYSDYNLVVLIVKSMVFLTIFGIAARIIQPNLVSGVYSVLKVK